MNIIFTKPSKKDLEIISKQLQLKNMNIQENSIIGIAQRCVYGCPKIVVISPIYECNNLPSFIANPIWLSCPYINEKIHKIEDNGFIKKITDFINSDRAQIDSMSDAHAHFYFFRKKIYRWAAFTNYPEEMIPLFNKGIGGLSSAVYLKCLHMHYAHYQFCSSNLAGHVTTALLNFDTVCSNGKCKN